MKKNKAMRIRAYMNQLPVDVRKSLEWEQDATQSKHSCLFANTQAVLKAYSYINYQSYSKRANTESLYKLVENELERYGVTILENTDTKIREIVKEIMADLIAQNDSVSKTVEEISVMIIIRQHIEKLKLIPGNGYKYYSVIQNTYIDNAYNLNIEELLQKLCMSRTHYYRIRNKAIDELSNIMWEE